MWCPLISAASTRWPMLKVFANLAIPRGLRVRLGLLVDSIVAQRISAWASLIDSANAAMPSELGIPPLGNPSHGFFSQPVDAAQSAGYAFPSFVPNGQKSLESAHD